MDKHLNHMEVRWKNFKGYKDTGWVKIKPLTVILGSNNSGKTNFLAPLLLMNQTTNSKDRFSPLILQGDVYDGGNYQEIVKDYITENEIFFGYRYHTHETDKKLKAVGKYPPGSFEVSFFVETKDSEIKLKSHKVYDIYQREFFSLERVSEGDAFKYSGIGTDSMTPVEKSMIAHGDPVNFMFTPNSILAGLDSASETKSPNGTRVEKELKTPQFTKGFSQLLAALAYNNSQTYRFLADLSFIGPIRQSPRRIYELTNESFSTVGSSGENLASMIKKLGENHEGLNKWVRAFGFGDGVKLQKHFGNTYSLRFTQDESVNYTTIANSGFGASQILPLIVQGLVSTKRSITIAEQPEIHLNPNVQSILADFLVEMTNRDLTTIVETHSEHLLLSLRRLIAEGKVSSDKVAVYFVEKTSDGSQIRPIEILEDGHINNFDWPKDFFADTLKESMRLATSQAKHNKQVHKKKK